MCLNRNADTLSFVMTAISILMTMCILCASVAGFLSGSPEIGYESILFDVTTYHTVEILVDNWQDFLKECENEKYVPCNVVIDGKRMNNVGLRAKGNTSLSNVRMMNSQRYSLKIEFDHYNSGETYYGLDKLCLNNLIQDNTYMKDYLTFRMMNEFGTSAPLCSYALVTVNGEPKGVYLAVEGVEDSFLLRNYGVSDVALYKPDTLGFGGGPGNGKDFRMDADGGMDNPGNGMMPPPPGMGGPQGMDGMPPPPGMGGPQGMDGMPPPPGMGGPQGMDSMPPPPGIGGPQGMDGMPPPPRNGSDDVLLKYIDDDPDRYPNIFGNAKKTVSPADKDRLIRALKFLSAEENLPDVLDIDRLLRYFVVHNYVVNGDSYTGGMVHNYYLCEKNGKLSMIPWDYNLAFGCFQNRGATSAVNDPVDRPLSVSGDGSRPMADWMLKGKYLSTYHSLFYEFLEQVDAQDLIDEAYAVIAPFAAQKEYDPTAFCERDEFLAGVATLKEFCALRSQSVKEQLETQRTQGGTFVSADHIDLAVLGTMGGPRGPGQPAGLGQTGGPGQPAGPGQAGSPGQSAAPGDPGNPGGRTPWHLIQTGKKSRETSHKRSKRL